MTEASACVEHGQLAKEVAQGANEDPERSDQVQRLESRADPSLDEKLDPACDRRQPEDQKQHQLPASTRRRSNYKTFLNHNHPFVQA